MITTQYNVYEVPQTMFGILKKYYLFLLCLLRDQENITNKKDKLFERGKTYIVFFKTNMIELEPAIILDYPLH